MFNVFNANPRSLGRRPLSLLYVWPAKNLAPAGTEHRPKRCPTRRQGLNGSQRIRRGDTNVRGPGTAWAITRVGPLRELRFFRPRSFYPAPFQTSDRRPLRVASLEGEKGR